MFTWNQGAIDRVSQRIADAWKYEAPNRTSRRAAIRAMEAVEPEVESVLAQQKEELGAVVTKAPQVYDAATSAARDGQVGGDHYRKHAIQPWDVIDAYGMGFYAGNALKYLLRYKDKGGVEDLKKARHYLDKLIEAESAEAPKPVPLDYGKEFRAGRSGGQNCECGHVRANHFRLSTSTFGGVACGSCNCTAFKSTGHDHAGDPQGCTQDRGCP